MASSLIAQVLPRSLGSILLAALSLLVTYQAAVYIYNIFFHPLRRFPGSAVSAASNLPLISQSVKGQYVFWIIRQHEKYGDVVRIAPNELSFSGADAYKDIYGHKKAGLPTLEKDPKFYGSPTGERDIVNANFEDHARQRRIFSHAFSDRALKLQEPLFLTYVDRLVEKLRMKVAEKSDQHFNMVEYLNFTTFDIMGDLTFGESLNMLDDSNYHPWVAAMLAGFRYGVYLHAIRYFPAVEAFLSKYCIPDSIRRKMKLNKEFSIQRVDRRLEKQDARPDIWGLVLNKSGTSGLTQHEMYTNAKLFMIAGTETTATLLSGLTYFLLTNPHKLEKLTKELRGSFVTEADITIERLQGLSYLNACIEEGLRMYPPVAIGMPRLTPSGAPTDIDGHSVPAETRVFVTNLAANRNPDNWRNPYEFIPERWLPQEADFAPYRHDKRHALVPFSTGPRACLGKNMAYHEMRLILTKILYNFDVSLCPESRSWADQEIWLMWLKHPLYCQLKPVIRM